jgi:hypothetical protein
MGKGRMRSFDDKPLTTSSGHVERCSNPFCKSAIAPLADGWRRTERRYCSDPCRMDGYVLRRARAMLDEVGIIEFTSRVMDVKA